MKNILGSAAALALALMGTARPANPSAYAYRPGDRRVSDITVREPIGSARDRRSARKGHYNGDRVVIRGRTLDKLARKLHEGKRLW